MTEQDLDMANLQCAPRLPPHNTEGGLPGCDGIHRLKCNSKRSQANEDEAYNSVPIFTLSIQASFPKVGESFVLHYGFWMRSISLVDAFFVVYE